MSYNLNNKNFNSTSIKIKKLSLIVEYMTEKISQCQEIKRMLSYNTQNPLSAKGITYDNEKINQPDIKSSLIGECIRDIGFNPEMAIDLKNELYVSYSNGRFDRGNRIYIDVNILVPEDYLRISNGYRNFEIAQYVAEIFDDVYVDTKNGSDYYKELGSIKFNLTEFNNYRLSKTNSIIWSNLTFEVELSPMGRAKV